MSSRVRSELGTLGERVGTTVGGLHSPAAQSGTVPRHVWVTLDQQRRPGLLVAWERRPDGWWGVVAWAPHGEALLERMAARWLEPL